MKANVVARLGVEPDPAHVYSFGGKHVGQMASERLIAHLAMNALFAPNRAAATAAFAGARPEPA